ncbi:MAG: replication initiation protein [Lachnospiraceae bacterium]|nr:replication initiation protein [Lachnospiraceae bacterium]
MAKELPINTKEYYSNDNFIKTNAMIHAKYKSSLMENKVLNLALANSSNGTLDKEGTLVVTMTVPEITRALGIKSHAIYQELDTIAATMTGRVMGISDPQKKTFKYASLIHVAQFTEDKRFIVKFSKESRELIENITEQYTRLKISTIASFRSVYSLRLYEALKSKAYIPKGEIASDKNKIRVEFGVAELQFQMGTVNMEVGNVKNILKESSKSGSPDYEKAIENAKERVNIDWRHFSRVLKSSIKEINEKTELNVVMEPISGKGRGGRIRKVAFYVDKNNKQMPEETFIELSEDEILDSIMEMAEEIERIKIADCKAIAKAAEYNLDRIRRAHEVAKQQKEFKASYTAFMVWAIKENVEPNTKNNNQFNNFKQRTYDYDELERDIMNYSDL